MVLSGPSIALSQGISSHLVFPTSLEALLLWQQSYLHGAVLILPSFSGAMYSLQDFMCTHSNLRGHTTGY